MDKSPIVVSYPSGTLLALYETFWESTGCGWATKAVLFLLSWPLLRLCFSRRRHAISGAPWSSSASFKTRLSKLISNADLRDLMISLEGKLKGNGRWEHVLDKSNDLVSYKAKLFSPKDGPLKYFSVAIFEKCSTEQLRDFYMDNQYRKKWDKILIHHERLQVDENSGTEVGRSIKKFPFFRPREYILAWRMWEGKDKTFYCFIKDYEHPLALQREKYVRVRFLRSCWRIRRVPGRDACEITMLHEEEAGINVEMAKVAFIKGIWGYVSKMNNALREYSSCRPIHSTSVPTLNRIIKKVPPELDSYAETSSAEELPRRSGGKSRAKMPQQKSLRSSKKCIANVFLLLGSIVCLSRGHASIGTCLVIACVSKKLIKHGTQSS
ncbi:stAR-related lipid transfer protein 7, mitochondrial [Canna indica]|uniref:StAR-related lipid transfer protein 7, mitochondrial n=1 Tax=Canna indica TaxID=4628 RepID=A0AAQ3KY59_9LILI|nr:stAR-related lipid transfer protein 7, mitochondrial [Canna indica]